MLQEEKIEWFATISIPCLAVSSSPSTTVSSIIVRTAPADSTDRIGVCRGVCCVGVCISRADRPPVAASPLSNIGSIVRCPLLGIHRAVDTLRDVLIAQHVHDDLVADVRLAGRWRMARVISCGSTASCSARNDAIFERLNVGESKEFVAHVCVLLACWVERSIDCAGKFDGACETRLRCGRCVLVVSVAPCDDNMEVVTPLSSVCGCRCLDWYTPSRALPKSLVQHWLELTIEPTLMFVRDAGLAQLVAFGKLA